MRSGQKTGNRQRSNRIGRNDNCFCGSKIKYKKCCLPKGLKPLGELDDAEKSDRENISSKRKRRQVLENKGIFIDLPNTIVFKDKSFLAVGNKIMWDDNPYSTFHQLILKNLSQTLGEDWWNSESDKPKDEKHYIKKCFEELSNYHNRKDLDSRKIDDNTHTMLATGDTQSLINLAFDVWLVAHRSLLPSDWVERLRDIKAYQGVRYEIAVASLFVRIGCELEFYDVKERNESGGRIKRAEFVAVHKETKNKVAVEAKSRHVKGALNEPGQLKYKNALKGDITKLYKKAVLKETDGLPLIVFIDVNSPTKTGQTVQSTKWFTDVKTSFESRPKVSEASREKHSALFITNYSHHYQGDEISRSGQYLFIGSLYPVNAFSDGINGDFMKKLQRAVSGYGYVPPTMDDSKTEAYEEPEGLDKQVFINKLRQLTSPDKVDPDYTKRKSESDDLVEMLVWDTTQKSGGDWDNKIAAECYEQFRWLYQKQTAK